MMTAKDDDNQFDDEQLLQYSRQIMLPDFGIEGQQTLHGAHVIIIGIGGLGSPAAMYLTASGVGRLTLIDFDSVERSNLQRQIAHNRQTLGENKALSAKQTLQALNPLTQIDCVTDRLSAEALTDRVLDAQCVIDATDNFETRFMINKVCHATRTPLVSGAAIRYEGQISVFDFRQDDCACYACLYSEDGEEDTGCSENGILAPVVGIIGSMQALETIKLLSGIGEPLRNRLLIFDALAMQWRTMRLRKDDHCPVCGKGR